MMEWRATEAFPSYARSIPNGDRVPCPQDIEGCSQGTIPGQPGSVCTGVGHATCAGGSMPLNEFGVDFKNEGFQWTKNLCLKDSDGDGLTNGEELGDPCCDGEFQSIDNEQGDSISHPGSSLSRISSEMVQQLSNRCEKEPASELETESSRLFLDDEPQLMKEFRISNFSIRQVQTDLPVFTFNIDAPECENNDCQIVGLEAIIDQPEFVHHFILRGCTSGFPNGRDGTQGTTMTRMVCPEWIAGWVPGRDLFFKAPWEAGLPLSASGSRPLKGWELEVHYDNPDRIGGAIDSSGFRMYYTTQPRKYKLGILDFVKILYAPNTRIPPGRDRYFLTQRCKMRGAEKPLNLSSVGFHAHYLGREMHVDMFRGEDQTTLWSDQHWDFDDQYIVDLEGATLMDGDDIQATCIYDSTGRTRSTIFGTESTDEMCQHTVYYFPASESAVCEDPGYYWLGSMEQGDDARTIYKDYPVESAEAVRSAWAQRLSPLGR